MTIKIDGSVEAGVSGSSIPLSLQIENNNDVIIVAVGTLDHNGYVTVSQIASSPSLTWKKRQSQTYYTSSGYYEDFEEWYAISPSSGSLSITVTLTSAPSWSGQGVAFGISGADTTIIFDSNANANPTGSGHGTTCSVSISTSNVNDLIVGLVSTSGFQPQAGSAYTPIQLKTQIGSEYNVVSSPQSGTIVDFSFSTTFWIEIADAIVAGPDIPAPPTQDSSAPLASSAGTAQDYSIPQQPTGKTLYTGNYIIAKVNGYRMLITDAQLQQYLDNGDDVEVVNLP
ncbi:MAG: hypothetical protein WCD81_07885 [Candidatus Bathyarchaeia archaeon]